MPILKKWGVKKELTPISSGVEEKEFQNADRDIIRRKYNIVDQEILLLLVSRLTAEKNIDFVFRSAAQVLKNNSRIKLLVVGGGNLQPELKNFSEKEKISDRVIFTGEIERRGIKNYYAAADIFVYASKSETQGMIITEAMYMGLPIVAVKATGSQSLILNKANGFLVKEDEGEFADAVNKLINDKELRKRFSQASRRIAETKFTSTVCAEKMLEVYERAIKNYSK
jgi:glycosyltransferase involved in cell wall biosynthesis